MLEHLEAQFLKILPLGANHGLFFMGLMYVQVWPKKTGDTSLHEQATLRCQSNQLAAFYMIK